MVLQDQLAPKFRRQAKKGSRLTSSPASPGAVNPIPEPKNPRQALTEHQQIHIQKRAKPPPEPAPTPELDAFGATPALREHINLKYLLVGVVGRGSYGCVSKAVCKVTGRTVAVKVMVGQTNTEYDTIKILREVQLLMKLNQISATLFS